MAARYTSISEVRQAPDIPDAVSDEDILEEIEASEEWLDIALGTSYTPVQKTETFIGDGTSIFLSDRIYLRSIDSVYKGATQVAKDKFGFESSGIIQFKEGVFEKGAVYEITTTAGKTKTAPEKLKTCAKLMSQIAVRDRLRQTSSYSSHSSVTNEFGTVTYNRDESKITTSPLVHQIIHTYKVGPDY